MTATPETARAVVDYLKEHFPGCEVPSVPSYEKRPEIYSFQVIGPDRRYRLEVSHECLDDLSESELERHLRHPDAAAKMRSSATRTAGLTTTGIGTAIGKQI
jgi:hypothetical protein